ncbi:hypothetical protein [Paraflavitalea speifideaquila]|uniref:hypothetical protein n=1 Tax=Paraflavitalea speifideaquila TaxID=3076558 RepID=UPI0028F09B4D|nr:hypothetical protein [Paraflavitalea speifideiaquila]
MSWAPACGGGVRTLVKSGSTLYVGGLFSTLGGATRNRVGAVDITTGALSAWNPNVTGNSVNAVAVNGSKIYLGGWFTNVGGTVRNNAAAVDATTGALDAAWNPNANNEINAIVVDGSQVILGASKPLSMAPPGPSFLQ